KSASQVGPQLIPAGSLVTVPEPVPPLVTFRVKLGVRLNVAVTLFAALIVTLHSFVPTISSQPAQTTALEPESAVPFSVTAVACGNLASQVGPQSIPAGVLLTVPVPVPFLVTF